MCDESDGGRCSLRAVHLRHVQCELRQDDRRREGERAVLVCHELQASAGTSESVA